MIMEALPMINDDCPHLLMPENRRKTSDAQDRVLSTLLIYN